MRFIMVVLDMGLKSVHFAWMNFNGLYETRLEKFNITAKRRAFEEN